MLLAHARIDNSSVWNNMNTWPCCADPFEALGRHPVPLAGSQWFSEVTFNKILVVVNGSRPDIIQVLRCGLISAIISTFFTSTETCVRTCDDSHSFLFNNGSSLLGTVAPRLLIPPPRPFAFQTTCAVTLKMISLRASTAPCQIITPHLPRTFVIRSCWLQETRSYAL